MWKTVTVGSDTLFMKYEREDNNHYFFLSDVTRVWMEKLTSSSLSQRCKEINSLIEAEPEDLGKHVYTLVLTGESDTTCFTRHYEGDICLVDLKSQLAGIPFMFTFRMIEVEPETVCTLVTQPLILLAIRQQKIVSHLCELLEAKDAEIEQFKLEGAVLKKKKLQTEPFNKDVMLASVNINCMNKETKFSQLFSEVCPYLFDAPKTTLNLSLSPGESAAVQRRLCKTEIPCVVESDHEEVEVCDESTAENKLSEEKVLPKSKGFRTKKPRLRI